MSDKPTVVTFRKHLHAIPLSEANVIDWSNPPSFIPAPLVPLVNIALSLFASSYLFWVIPVYVVFFYLYLIGYYYIPIIISLAYLPFFLDKVQCRFGRPSDIIRTTPLWNYIQRYGEYEIVRLSPPLDATKQYIFGVYPHNLLILSRSAVYGGVFDLLFPGIDLRVLGASTMFYIPLCRELCLALGAVDAGRKTAERILKTDKTPPPAPHRSPYSMMLYPGGVAEMLHTDNNKNDTDIVARKGFIRLAIENGSSLIPVYVFNEEKLYERSQSKWLKSIEKFLWKAYKFPWVWFHGRFFTFLPYLRSDRPLTVIFGHPIDVTKNASPSDEEIQTVYDKFYGAIEKLYTDYKMKLGYNETDKLIIKLAEEKKHQQRRGSKTKKTD